MQLRLSSCTVRSWQKDDGASIVLHANNRSVWRNLRDRFPHPYTASDAEAWLWFTGQEGQETHFAIDVAGAAVGGIGLELQSDVFRRSAEIGYWLGEAYWGRGIATEAVVAVTEHAFRRFDISRVFAGVFEWNLASMRVLEKAGYAREGVMRKSVTKDGSTIDQVLYAVVREES